MDPLMTHKLPGNEVGVSGFEAISPTAEGLPYVAELLMHQSGTMPESQRGWYFWGGTGRSKEHSKVQGRARPWRGSKGGSKEHGKTYEGVRDMAVKLEGSELCPQPKLKSKVCFSQAQGCATAKHKAVQQHQPSRFPHRNRSGVLSWGTKEAKELELSCWVCDWLSLPDSFYSFAPLISRSSSGPSLTIISGSMLASLRIVLGHSVPPG